MKHTFIESFLIQFFEENSCHIKQIEPGIIEIELSVSMDKALMNRPFYWQYMESTNQIGTPWTVRFITDKDKRDEKGEWIPYGSPRLQQINDYLKKQARFTRLFQQLNTQQHTMLHPWLLTNYCIRYEGKQNKEEFFSIGLNLINGVMILDMMNYLSNISLASVISNHCYTVSPLIKLKSGFLRIENYIEGHITNQDHQWAIDSHNQLEEELQMIDYFYKSNQSEVEFQQDREGVINRLAPSISHEVINGGIFYLDQNFLNKQIKKAST